MVEAVEGLEQGRPAGPPASARAASSTGVDASTITWPISASRVPNRAMHSGSAETELRGYRLDVDPAAAQVAVQRRVEHLLASRRRGTARSPGGWCVGGHRGRRQRGPHPPASARLGHDSRAPLECGAVEPKEGAVGRRWAALGTLAVAVVLMLAPAAAASQPSSKGAQADFTARGSAEQVQVTGASPGERLKLIDRGGGVVGTKRAGSLGGIVFRRVDPGGGYRVRGPRGVESPALRVLTNRPEPPDTSIYGQRLPAGGYGYMTTRDGTKLAIDVHLPGPADQGPYPTLIEYSGYGYAEPERAPELDPADRPDPRIRGGRRQHARHGLLGRRLRLLRAAAVARRLRRDRDGRPPALGPPPQSRDDRRLVRRHQPALRRLHPPAASERDRPAVGDRQLSDDALPGRHPQHRLRTAVGRGPRARRQARRPRHGSRMGVRADPGRGRGLRGQPGPAPGGGRPGPEDQAQQLLPSEGRRSGLADHLRPQDRRAGFLACQWTDEQTGGHCPRPALALHGHGPEVVHVHERRPRRLARPGDVQPLVRLPAALRRARETGAARRGQKPAPPPSTPPSWGSRASNCPRQDPAASRTSTPHPGAVRGASRRFASCFDNGAGGDMPGVPVAVLRDLASASSRPIARRRDPGIWARGAR